MKKLYFTFFLFFYVNLIHAQDNKYQILAGGNLGFSRVELNEQKLNASTNGAYIYFDYNLKILSIESGLEYTMSEGNFNSLGNSFFIENKYLNIPLGITRELKFKTNSEDTMPKYSVLLGMGLYTNYLLKSELQNVYNEKYIG